MKTTKTTMIVALSLLALLALTACSAQETPAPALTESPGLDYVIAEGRVVPIQHSVLSFLAQGRVTEILVAEGERVGEDQTLARLADRESAGAALEAAELELLSAQQALDDFNRTADLSLAAAWEAYLDAQTLRGELEEDWEDLDLDYLEDRVDDALVDVRDREYDLDEAREDWEKYADVSEENYARQTAEDDLEDAQEDYNQAQRELEEARREIDGPRSALDAALAAEAEALRDYELWSAEGFDPDQKALLEARLNTALANRAAARKALEGYDLKAPYPGTVTDIYFELGQLIGPDLPAILLADLGEFQIESSDLTELEVVMVEQGQVVEIVPDALPELTLLGTVERIGQSFTTQAGDILYTVTIQLDETDPRLRWGMTVELTFLEE